MYFRFSSGFSFSHFYRGDFGDKQTEKNKLFFFFCRTNRANWGRGHSVKGRWETVQCGGERKQWWGRIGNSNTCLVVKRKWRRRAQSTEHTRSQITNFTLNVIFWPRCIRMTWFVRVRWQSASWSRIYRPFGLSVDIQCSASIRPISWKASKKAKTHLNWWRTINPSIVETSPPDELGPLKFWPSCPSQWNLKCQTPEEDSSVPPAVLKLIETARGENEACEVDVRICGYKITGNIDAISCKTYTKRLDCSR